MILLIEWQQSERMLDCATSDCILTQMEQEP